MTRSRWTVLVAVALVVLGTLGGGAAAVVRGHEQRATTVRHVADDGGSRAAGASDAVARAQVRAEARAEQEQKMAGAKAAAAAEARVAAAKARAARLAAQKASARRAAAAAAASERPASARPADADAAARAAGWHDAASRTHCSAPDQVWTASNGRIPPGDLATIPWSSGDRVRADVVDGLQRLDAAFAAAFGRHLSVTSAYRTHAQQESLYDPASKIAAPPGCSNHGTGLAVDLGGGVQTFGSTEYDWLKAHAPAYGWVHPPFAEPGGRNPEPWHWQSVRAPNSR